VRAVLTVLCVALAAGLAWLLLRPQTPGYDALEEDARDTSGSDVPRPAAPTPLGQRPETPAMAETPAAAPGGRAPRPPVREKGQLVVVPVAPEGGSVPNDLRIDIEMVGATLTPHPLPVPQDDGSYRYLALPVGKYRVRLFSDLIVDSVAEAKVEEGVPARLEMPLVSGGHAQVKVVLYNGEAPPRVTFALKDGRGAPVSARYEGRSETFATSPRVGESVTMPPETVVSGLKPGRYTLRATSPAGEFEEETFEVRAGEGTPVALKVRR
jgi:hypothetical protein